MNGLRLFMAGLAVVCMAHVETMVTVNTTDNMVDTGDGCTSLHVAIHAPPDGMCMDTTHGTEGLIQYRLGVKRA